MDTKTINIAIPLLIMLFPFVLAYVVYVLVKKRQRKPVISAISIFAGILTLIAVFYAPVRITLPDPQQFAVSIYRNGQKYEVVNPEEKKELKEMVEKRKFIRSVSKTLGYIPPYPSNQFIDVTFIGTGVPFHLYVVVRSDKMKYSFVDINFQRYSILDTETFVRDVFDFASRAELRIVPRVFVH